MDVNGSIWGPGNRSVALRTDAYDLVARLAPDQGRRPAGHTLSAFGLAVALHTDANWADQRIRPWSSVSWAHQWGYSYHRFARDRSRLQNAGIIASMQIERFRPGSVVMATPGEQASLLHQHKGPDPFIMLRVSELRRLQAPMPAPRNSARFGLLVCLALQSWKAHSHEIRGWTMRSLASYLSLGYRRLKASLDDLQAAGYVRYTARRGKPLELALTKHARQALMPLPLPRHEAATRDRSQRQATRRSSRWVRRHGQGSPQLTMAPALATAQAIVAAFRDRGYAVPDPTWAMVRAVDAALAAGATTDRLVEYVVGHGSLSGARDVLAVIARRVGDFAAVAQAEQAARDRQKREIAATLQRIEADKAQAEQDARARSGQDQWVAGQLSEYDRARLVDALHVAPLIAGNRWALQAYLRAEITALVAHYPDTDPVALVRLWADHPCRLSNPAEVAALAPRVALLPPRDETAHGPPGTLPTAT